MSFYPKSEVEFLRGEGRVIILLVAFVEGGVRISMNKLLINYLRHFKVCLDQCTPNVFRVVSCVAKPNKRLGHSLTEHEINYIYSFQDSKTSGFYFKAWHKELRLISCLPNCDKETVKKVKKTLNVKVESSNLLILYELMTEAKLDCWDNSSNMKDRMKKSGKQILVRNPRKWLKGHYQSLCPLRSQESKSVEGRIPRKTRRKRRTLKRKA